MTSSAVTARRWLIPLIAVLAGGGVVRAQAAGKADALLQRMADQTGGKFWRVTSGDAIRQAFREVNALEKTNIETSQFTRYEELFPQYLRWAVALYFVATFLGATLLRKGP